MIGGTCLEKEVQDNTEMAVNRPFAAKPSRDLLYMKLWATTLKMPEMGKKNMSKISKWSSLRPLALKNEIK